MLGHAFAGGLMLNGAHALTYLKLFETPIDVYGGEQFFAGIFFRDLDEPVDEDFTHFGIYVVLKLDEVVWQAGTSTLP